MPTALKLQEEYPETLSVLFVETDSRRSREDMQSFAIDKGWFENRDVMWTKEKPFDLGLKYIPAFALLDTDGGVITSGLTGRMHGEIEEIVEERAKSASKGPDGVPSAVRKLWKQFGKGKWDDALADARELVADPGRRDPEETKAAAEAALATFSARAERELARVRWLVDEGCLVKAEEVLDDLEDRLEDDAELGPKLAELRARLESDDLEDERDACEELARLEEKMYEKGRDKVSLRSLEKIQEKHPGSRAARRAGELMALVDED